LGSLNLLLDELILARLGIFQLLGELELFGLLVLCLFLLLGLDNSKDLFGMALGFEGCFFGKLFFFHLMLTGLLKVLLIFGLQRLLSDLTTLGSLSEFLTLSLRLLHDLNDVLGSLFNSVLHLDIKSISDFGCLLVHKSRSSLLSS
jgi:hypothetical protein